MAQHFPSLTAKRPAYLGGEHWDLSGLTDITVILGRNGSGKSQLLRALRDQDPKHVHYASPERGGQFTFDVGHAQQEFDAAARAQHRGQNFCLGFREQALGRIWTVLIKRGADRRANVPVVQEQMEDLINELLPGLRVQLTSDPANPCSIRRVDTEAPVRKAEELSSGEAQLLSLGLDLVTIAAVWSLDGQQKRLLLIDEPDLHLHPDMHQAIARFISGLVERMLVQVVIATHSTTLMAAVGHAAKTSASVLYLDSRFGEQHARPFTEELRELATVLGGHALMGAVFAAPLLLVEGDDDYRVWTTAVRKGGPRLAVLPCSGQAIVRYARRLEQLFNALLDAQDTPSAYMLRDRDDKGDPSADPDAHVVRLRMSCHETENLYLTDEVLLAMGLDWATARQQLREQAANYGNKRDAIAAAADADRETMDLKGIIVEVARILDPKPIDWRDRLGQVLGRSKPTGQLAAYLGKPVVDALWGPESSAESKGCVGDDASQGG